MQEFLFEQETTKRDFSRHSTTKFVLKSGKIGLKVSQSGGKEFFFTDHIELLVPSYSK